MQKGNLKNKEVEAGIPPGASERCRGPEFEVRVGGAAGKGELGHGSSLRRLQTQCAVNIPTSP